MENFKCWSHLIKQCTIGTQRPISKRFDTTQINPLTQGMALFINQILSRKEGIQNLVNAKTESVMNNAHTFCIIITTITKAFSHCISSGVISSNRLSVEKNTRQHFQISYNTKISVIKNLGKYWNSQNAEILFFNFFLGNLRVFICKQSRKMG